MASQGTPTVWIRRCKGCGDDDLRAAFGHQSIIDDRPWRCPHCWSPAWDPAALPLPATPPTGSGCPAAARAR